MREPAFSDQFVTVYKGDCVEVMREMPEASVDAVVTDPPYGLGFMNKGWDKPTGQEWGYFAGSGKRPSLSGSQEFQFWCTAWATEALRVLKPGAHLAAFGGTRTFHRLTCALEDAGFEIRDSIGWVRTARVEGVVEAWRRWSLDNAGIRFQDPVGSSVPAPVLLGTSLENSPARALIAELRSSEPRLTDAAFWRSALSNTDAPTTELSALVSIAGLLPESLDARSSIASTARVAVPDWLAVSMGVIIRAVGALRIWSGSPPSLRLAATDVLGAALTDALKHITCAQSETFRNCDTTWQMVCASATTVTITESMAANLISFMVATLNHSEGGDAEEAAGGPLAWVYGSGFP